MVNWLCDICGTPGTIHPKTEPITKVQTIKVEVPDPDNIGKMKIQEIQKEVPETTILRRQDVQTGTIQKHVIQATRDLEPRSIIVSLKFGNENIQKDFCVECYNKHIKRHVEKMYIELEKIESK